MSAEPLAVEGGGPLLGLAEAASILEKASPGETLAWAARSWPGRVVLATGFGAEGCVLVDLVARLGLPIRLITLDTGYLFAETLELRQRLETRYGVTIQAIKPAPQVVEQEGRPLHKSDPDLCCHLRKVEPLRGFLAGESAWITAIRRDQSPDRASARVVSWDARFGLIKVNPLVAWTEAQVWHHLREHDVPTHALYARGYRSIGCAPCTTPASAGEDARAGRWRGSAKTECGLHVAARRPLDLRLTIDFQPEGGV